MRGVIIYKVNILGFKDCDIIILRGDSMNGNSNYLEEEDLSMYEKIALDIAYAIVNDDFKPKEIISGRTTLSAQYEVSPETIRRALKLLEEEDVVKSILRKGVVINDKKFAVAYLNQFNSKKSILSLRERLYHLKQEKEKIEEEMFKDIDEIINMAIVFRNLGMINPLEFDVPKGSHLVGKSIGQIKFWANTGATIIGVNRENKIILSPGPDFIFNEKDKVYYVANKVLITEKIESYIEKKS